MRLSKLCKRLKSNTFLDIYQDHGTHVRCDLVPKEYLSYKIKEIEAKDEYLSVKLKKQPVRIKTIDVNRRKHNGYL